VAGSHCSTASTQQRSESSNASTSRAPSGQGDVVVARASKPHGEAALRTDADREDSHGEGAAASRHPSGRVEGQHRTDEQRRGGNTVQENFEGPT
jgi:hypothetical protein